MLEQELRDYLRTYQKKTIDLHQLQDIVPSATYRSLAPIILLLLQEGVLVGGNERNHKDPNLPKKYKVISGNLQTHFFEQIRILQVKRHPLISLDAYYKLRESAIQDDLPWIEKLEHYLANRDLRRDRSQGIPLPEASYQMVGNEKWLEEEGGQKILRRVGLSLEELGLVSVPEPLMFAMNPKHVQRREFCHLIVENKTPFHAFLQRFHQQDKYSTLIFGRGKMIMSSIQRFYQQTGLDPRAEHRFFYFGDLDYEGIGIWHSLAKMVSVEPAIDLYQKLLEKTHGPGKENHRPLPTERDAFCMYFQESDGETIRAMLDKGHYLPQEAVTSAEWAAYWRD